jgi:signal transduction histidine kinase
METRLRILHLEDNPTDAALIARAIGKGGITSEITLVDSRKAFLAALEQGSFDMILADHALISFDGLAALSIAREKAPGTPFIFVSASLDEEVAIESLKVGATDYVFKHRLSRLVPCINRALEEIAGLRARRQMEAISRAREVAEATNRMKSQFLASMSHELRTPLNSIIGFSELMYDGKVGRISSRHKEYLGDILSSAKHILQLINDLLDLSKVEAGKMEFHPEQVDLPRIVTQTCDTLRGMAVKKRLNIQAELEPELTSAVVDPSKLKQVLYNYLSNAIKFTPEGGRIHVRVRSDESNRFRIEVEDNGIGIPSGDQERLFNEFRRVSHGKGEDYPGTGLGLLLTKRIVEAQGGTVGVRSESGVGSTFFAILPRNAVATGGLGRANASSRVLGRVRQ